MNISKEHIEELIFEYHEGNLSDGEKSELMNIIHQYPEFEADFALWAQTYAHVEDSVPDYGLAANLIQKAPIAWDAHVWVKAGLASVLVASSVAGYWLLRSKTEPKPTTPIVQQIEVKNETKELVKSTTKSNINMNYNSYNSNQTSKISKTLEVLETQSTVVCPQTDLPISGLSGDRPRESEVANQVVEIEEETSKVPQTLEVLESTKPDTVQKTTIAAPKKTLEEKPQKKAKRKLPLNLRPAADFMPVNPNF